MCGAGLALSFFLFLFLLFFFLLTWAFALQLATSNPASYRDPITLDPALEFEKAQRDRWVGCGPARQASQVLRDRTIMKLE